MCEVLTKLLNNEPVEPVTLIKPQNRVVDRASTDYFAVKNEKLRLMIHYACDHFAEGLTVLTLAEKFSIPMLSACRLFYNYLRNSPKHFLIELQLKHAEELMKRGNMKMQEVTKGSGFATLKSFYDFFKIPQDTSERVVLPQTLKSISNRLHCACISCNRNGQTSTFLQ